MLLKVELLEATVIAFFLISKIVSVNKKSVDTCKKTVFCVYLI